MNFVLLHGFCGQPEQWRYLQNELEGRGHTTLALRLPRGSWDAEIAAVRVVADGALVVGHSMGGLLVRAFAEAHPNVAAGLATIAGVPPRFESKWLTKVGSWDELGWFRCNVGPFLDIAFPGAPEELFHLTWVQPPMKGDLELAGGRGSEPRVSLVCTHDRAVPYADQLRAAKEFNAPTVDLPGGHSPHVSAPAAVASILINWLAPEAA